MSHRCARSRVRIPQSGNVLDPLDEPLNETTRGYDTTTGCHGSLTPSTAIMPNGQVLMQWTRLCRTAFISQNDFRVGEIILYSRRRVP
jgi:hypothetical protein